MKKKYIIAIAVIVFVMAGAFAMLALPVQKETMDYPSFLTAVEENKVASVTFETDGNTFTAHLHNSDTDYTVTNPKTDNFVEYLLKNNILIEYGSESILLQAGRTILLVFFLGLILFTAIKNTKGKLKVTDVQETETKESQITFGQIAGNAEAKAMVQDIIQFMKSPERYHKLGARMPKGILLYGPPGTGKTLMAKAIAGTADVPFFAMSGSDFVQMYVGVGASRVRDLFEKAKKHEKAVIFIDEIDAIGKTRAANASASNDERDQTLNALLTEMSGFHENSGIIVIGATNRLDTLDEALLRPGRFDRQIEINLPDINSRYKILSLYMKSKPLADDVDIHALAKTTAYFSGAMLENLVNEAAIQAANENKEFITREHLEVAFYTVIAGAPKEDRSFITDQDRRITAYHEAGHALATTLLLPDQEIAKVTIIPSVRGAGGFNINIPKDSFYMSQRQLKSNIQMLLAGRAAEELIFGKEEITTGAGNDIQKASSQMVDYINKFGMDPELGLFSSESLGGTADSKLIEKCREEIKILYQQMKDLLEENLDKLEQIAGDLLIKETLSGDDIKKLAA